MTGNKKKQCLMFFDSCSVHIDQISLLHNREVECKSERDVM